MHNKCIRFLVKIICSVHANFLLGSEQTKPTTGIGTMYTMKFSTYIVGSGVAVILPSRVCVLLHPICKSLSRYAYALLLGWSSITLLGATSWNWPWSKYQEIPKGKLCKDCSFKTQLLSTYGNQGQNVCGSVSHRYCESHTSSILCLRTLGMWVELFFFFCPNHSKK